MDARGWGSQETRCLVSVWGEESVQRKLDDSYRNREIYEGISQHMRENGYARSWLQCQRKIKHLKHVYRKTKDNGNGISCPDVYRELRRVLGDGAAFSSCEGNVLDSELDNNQEEYGRPVEEEDDEPPVSATAENTNVTLDGNDTTGPEAAVAASSPSPSSSSSSSSKRPSSTSGGQPKRKKSRFEMTLEAFTKALCNSKDDNEVLLQMQRAQHAHEEKMFGMMMQSIASLGSRMASAQQPAGHTCPASPPVSSVSADATTSTSTTSTSSDPPSF